MDRKKFKSILGLLAIEDKKQLDEMLKGGDMQGVRDYLDKLKALKDKINKTAVTSAVGNSTMTPIKNFKADNYEWIRYKGVRAKNIMFQGNVVKILPREIFGISKDTDSQGRFQVILPSMKEKDIYLDASIVDILKAKSKRYSGDIDAILKFNA